MSINLYYSTSDLACAGVLSLYFPLDSLDKQNPHKVLFIFKRDQHLDKILEAYWQGQLQVEPRAFFNQIKLIKSRLYE